MTIQSLFKSWKTTSIGISSIIGIVVHLIFEIKAGTAGENVWSTSLVGIVLACGLIFAGDASAPNQPPPTLPPTTS